MDLIGVDVKDGIPDSPDEKAAGERKAFILIIAVLALYLLGHIGEAIMDHYQPMVPHPQTTSSSTSSTGTSH